MTTNNGYQPLIEQLCNVIKDCQIIKILNT